MNNRSQRLAEEQNDERSTTNSLEQFIHRIYISRGHNFFGHFGQAPGQFLTEEASKIQCIAHRGLVGDRFFDHQEDYKGQVTFFSLEVFEKLRKAVCAGDLEPSAVRRNVITAGIDLNQLIGRAFEIQGLKFAGEEECRPCAWMDQAVAPGAHEFLKGNGGLRARILSTGTLQVGDAQFRFLDAVEVEGGV